MPRILGDSENKTLYSVTVSRVFPDVGRQNSGAPEVEVQPSGSCETFNQVVWSDVSHFRNFLFSSFWLGLRLIRDLYNI